MKKRVRVKAKVLRKIRRIPVTAMIFHYGSIMLKAGELPFTDVVYGFILEYLYDGYAGIIIKPVCEWLWNCEWYETIYHISGKPSLILAVVLTCLIYLKEQGGKVKEKKYTSFFSDFGTYSVPKTSLFFRSKNLIRRKMLGNEVNVAKEGMQLVILRVINGKEEKLFDMTYESECFISEKIKAIYDRKNDAIILETGKSNRKILYKGEKIISGNIVAQYL